MITPTPGSERLHLAALRRTGVEPELLGYILRRHREAEGLSPHAQAELLGVPLAKLAWLAFCQPPRAELFEQDVEYFARRSGADLPALANLIRQEQAVADPAVAERNDSEVGWLLAAHDAEQAPTLGGGADAGPEPAR